MPRREGSATAERGEAVFRPIRRRLTAWYVGVLSAVLMAAGLIVYLETGRALFGTQDETLRVAAEFAARVLVPALRHEALEHGPGEGLRSIGDLDEIREEPLAATLAWTYVRVQEGRELRLGAPARATTFPHLASARTASVTGEESVATLRSGREYIRIYNLPVREGGRLVAVVQTGLPITPAVEALRRIRIALVLLGLLSLAAAAAGGLFLAGRALVPIRQAFWQLRSFTADASHELRTPLAIVRTSAEMLGRRLKGAPPEVRELVDNVLTEAERMQRLVGDLLALARADAGEVEMESAPVNLSHVAAEAARKAGVLARDKGLDLEARIEPELTVRGDAGRLLQLALILLDNAVKYTDPGGRVELRAERRGRNAVLSVRDTGIGIPPQDLQRVFDRFYRVDKARSRAEGGAGLGLAIAAWIARAHGGHIRAESEPGRGSTFTVEIPLQGG